MKAKSVIARGELVSDELVIGLIMNNLKRPSCINGSGIINILMKRRIIRWVPKNTGSGPKIGRNHAKKWEINQ